MRRWSVLENVSWVEVISPVADEPAARDKCRGGCTGADTEKSVFRHVLSAVSDQWAETPFEASEPTRPVREFIIACGLAAYGKRRSSDYGLNEPIRRAR